MSEEKPPNTQPRRGRRPEGKGMKDLPVATIEALNRLIDTTGLTVRQLDAQLGLAEQGVKSSAVTKYVQRRRAASGCPAQPGRRPFHRKDVYVDQIAVPLLQALEALAPGSLVDLALTRMVEIRAGRRNIETR